MSVDPLIRKYPELTPYQFASNTPIGGIDLDGLEVFIAVETMGTGHAFLVVKTCEELIVYTYGRFGAVNADIVTGEGVLQRLTGKAAVDYINFEATRMGASFYEVKDVTPEKVKSTIDVHYNKGVNSTQEGTNGKVIDEYSLFSSNCATHSCDFLVQSGSEVFKESTVGIEYNEDFVIPSSLQTYLKEECNNANKPLTDASDQMKMVIAEEEAKEKMQGAGTIAETSGSSGNSSGSSANSSSSGSSSGRNTSSGGSLGSSAGSSIGSSSGGPAGASSGSSSGASSGSSSGSSSGGSSGSSSGSSSSSSHYRH